MVSWSLCKVDKFLIHVLESTLLFDRQQNESVYRSNKPSFSVFQNGYIYFQDTDILFGGLHFTFIVLMCIKKNDNTAEPSNLSM